MKIDVFLNTLMENKANRELYIWSAIMSFLEEIPESEESTAVNAIIVKRVEMLKNADIEVR